MNASKYTLYALCAQSLQDVSVCVCVCVCVCFGGGGGGQFEWIKEQCIARRYQLIRYRSPASKTEVTNQND